MNERMKPEIKEVGVERGRLVILGKNIPQGSGTINLELKSDLITNLASGEANISDYHLAFDTLKSNIKTKISLRLVKDKIPTAQAQVNKLLANDENLNELLGLPPKPVVKVKGRASLDGRFGYNKQLAMKRAKNAIKGLKDQYGDNYKFEPVAEVIGPNGEKVDTANQGYNEFKKEWNKKFPDKKIDSAAKMKDLINSYARGTAEDLTESQKKWLQKRIDMVRGVQVNVTGHIPDKIKIQYNNTKEQEPIAQA
jgi:hypothetical protein